MYANARNTEHGRYLSSYPPAAAAPPPNNPVPAPSNVFRNAEERGAGPNSRQRMSLLPPPQSDYHASPQHGGGRSNERQGHSQTSHYGSGDGGMMNKHAPPMSESPPCKKPRLGPDSKPDMHMPLRIDTDRARSGPAYNPQVEAISPTLPSESIRDESPLRSTKEDLLLNIARVDREIAKTESQIAKLKKKKIELEDAATQPQKQPDESTSASDSVIQSLPQSIYADNRKKAAEAHESVLKLGPHNDLPLYNQPSDTPVYHENIAKYNEFKSTLVKHFKIKQRVKEKRDTYLTKTYAELSIEWARNVERIENTPKKKGQEAKKRELFEKVFPELRKQREDKERFSRVSRIKSDADLEEIMDGLHEQEMEDKKMRSYAVIPPALLDAKTRSRRFMNTNGLIEDPMQEYKDKQFLNLWTDQEKEIFKEKYLQHPKNFGIIKSYLERKCIPDCVLYYYLSKKTENYRQLLRKSRARPRTRNQGNHNNNPQTQNNNSNNNNNSNSASSGNNQVLNVGKAEANGVTTRGQKEQKTDTPSSVSSPVPSAQGNNGSNSNPEGMNNAASSSSPPTNIPVTNMEENSANTTQSTPATEPFGGQQRKTHKDDGTNEMNDMDTSDDELDINGDKGGPHACVCCKTQVENFLQSRPISRSQASMYGLSENDIQISDRVCVSCRCKAVRRRTKSSQCPLPTCPAKRARIKRLRPFPPKWPELDEYRRSAIIAKYQIPENCTKCCTACFNRINRRMAPNASLDTPDDPGCDTTQWSDQEIELVKKGLSEVGTDWVRLSEGIPSKSELQCRNFYLNYRKKYRLEAIVQEHRKVKGGHGPPTLTDEEESGSTTSSCDETGASPHDQPHNPSIEKKQDDYDSSATVSAEEGVIEPDKPNSHEEMKTFPNNPDSPLSLTIRANLNVANAYPQSQMISNKSIMSHNNPPPSSHGIRSGSPGGAYLPSVTVTPRHPHMQHHPQINSPSPHQYNAPQNFSHSQSGGTHSGPPSGLPHHISAHQGSRRYAASPDNSDNQEPMTLKVNDLLQATIEKQLRMKPAASNNSSGHHPGPSVSPTITSILKSQDRSYLPPPGSQQILAQIHQSHTSSQNEPPSSHHPQLSVAPNMFPYQHHGGPSYYGPTKVERITQHHVSHEGLSMIQVPQRDECGTLDLSMKKRSPSPHMNAHRPPSNGPPPAHQPIDYASRPQPSNDLYYQNKFGNIRGSSGRPQPPPAKQSKVQVPPPPLTKPPSLSPMKDGSITHGTPMHHQASMSKGYEGLLRPKEGSITQGTPMEKMRGKDTGPTYVSFDRPDYYKQRVPPNAPPYFHGAPSPFYGQRPPSTGQRNSPPTGHPPSPYASDQHNNSRQIIINDYYTSQQMQNPPGVVHSPHMSQNSISQQRLDPSKRAGPTNMQVQANPLYGVPSRQDIGFRQSPSPSHQPHQQQRQGVIQRTNSHRQLGVVVKAEPGRNQDDAFARLVEAASSAPSLPVPKEEPRNRVNLPRVDMVREGLGKSMAEIERNRNNVAPPQQQQQPQMYRANIPIQSPQNAPEVMRAERIRLDADRFSRDGGDATLTAASLIDAIITHQINQPSPNDRQSPAPSRSDRLFASFQRSSQQQQQQQQQQQAQQPAQHSPVSAASQQHNTAHQSNNPPNVQLNAHLREERIHREEEKAEDISRGAINHKTTQGGTWGEHINFIISNDYALGKGSSNSGSTGVAPAQHISPVSHSPSLVAPPSHSPKKEDQVYRSWKLRLALQREKEQLQKENHPDERNIIRVSQNEDGSRPPSHPAYNEGTENGNEESGTQNAIPSGTNATSDRYSGKAAGSKDAISPLDYVNNLIVARMRTENVDEKGDHEGNNSSSVLGNNSQSTTATTTSTTPNPPPPTITTTASQQNHSGNFSNSSSMSNTEDRSSSSIGPDTLRYTEASQQEKKDDENRKIEESDSPASMIIDESAEDGKANLASAPESNSTTTITSNQPNYEPLTDDES